LKKKRNQPIVEAIAESAPAIVGDMDLARTFDETEKSTALEAASIREEATTIAASSTNPEAEVAAPVVRQPDFEAVNAPAVEWWQEVVADIPAEASVANEMTAPPMMENDDSQPETLRERVVGWFKRTLTRLLTLMGARI
jgi:hypothetical protein